MTNFSCKKGRRSTYTYRANCWKQLVETWHVDEVIIVGVPFWNQEKEHRNITQNPTSIKISDMIKFVNKKICPYNCNRLE